MLLLDDSKGHFSAFRETVHLRYFHYTSSIDGHGWKSMKGGGGKFFYYLSMHNQAYYIRTLKILKGRQYYCIFYCFQEGAGSMNMVERGER